MAKNETALEVKNLCTYFYTEDGIARAVDDVSFKVNKGEVLGIVGESGSGKSVTSFSIMRLISSPGRTVAGEIIYKDKNILELSDKEMREIRGNEIAMIFQEPMTSLNPVFTIGDQIMEAVILHKKITKEEAEIRAIKMLELVGIPSPADRLYDYPHQFSGGMRQRVMIAMALSCNPSILIADEPTTALDVTIQAQILDLMIELKDKLETAILLITHDMGVIAEVAQQVAVMYCGKIQEYADVRNLFHNPVHPYTIGLLGSIPRIDNKNKELDTIRGTVPNILFMPKGCKFSTRCDYCMEKCHTEEPKLEEITKGHWVRCWRAKEMDKLKKSKLKGVK